MTHKLAQIFFPPHTPPTRLLLDGSRYIVDHGRIICFIGPYEEHCCCVRHLFLVTSAMKSTHADIDTTSSSPVPYGVSVATGDYGGKGNGEKAELKVVEDNRHYLKGSG